MDNLKMMSMDNTQENIEKIKALFPNCVTEVIREGKVELAVDFDMLKQEMSNILIDDKEERYLFTWPDKRKSILLANSPINATLRPRVEESVDFENSQNIFIEGDNLDVLKLLQETYLGKVDVIYIDPPYNTGNSLIYHNDFFKDASEYVLSSGQYDEYGNRITQNTENNGRFHTDWLNMIYPRLKVAKDLLKDTGILVLTIDDYEINTVTTVLNEIFSEENHLGTVVIKNNPSGRSTVKGFSVNHEYALFYAKSDSATLGRMRHNDLQRARYKERDEKGYFEWENFRKNGTDSDRNDRPKQFYPIIINEATNSLRIPNVVWNDVTRDYTLQDILVEKEKILLPITPVGTEKVWKYGIERARVIINEILVKKTQQGYELYRKKYLNEDGSLPHTWWDKPEYSARDNGTRTLTNIFGPSKVFDFPKAPEAVKDALISANLPDDGLVLDFFAGSGTTAQEVLELNAEDGGKRRFIMVQLPEPCATDSEAYKSGFKNISDISKERIRRVGKIIADKNRLMAPQIDIGFRVLKLDSSNMKDVYYKPNDYQQNLLDDFTDNIKEDRTPLDLLFQVMLDLGKPLSAKIEEKVIAGKKVFVVNTDDLICCFDNNITDEVVTEIAKMHPLYAVFRDSGLSTDSVGANFDQIFETYSSNTIRKVL